MYAYPAKVGAFANAILGYRPHSRLLVSLIERAFGDFFKFNMGVFAAVHYKWVHWSCDLQVGAVNNCFVTFNYFERHVRQLFNIVRMYAYVGIWKR